MSLVVEAEIIQLLGGSDTQITFQTGGYCRCSFNLLDQNGAIQLLELQKFINFCAERQIQIRSRRNGAVLPASFGAVFSDMRSSEAFKQAHHFANHPKNTPTAHTDRNSHSFNQSP